MMSSVMTQGHLLFQVSCFALFNTPLHNYMCIKINVIYLGIHRDVYPLAYPQACTEIPFAFVVISHTPSISCPINYGFIFEVLQLLVLVVWNAKSPFNSHLSKLGLELRNNLGNFLPRFKFSPQVLVIDKCDRWRQSQT